MALDKDLSSIQEARDLANAAYEAWKVWSKASQAEFSTALINIFRPPARLAQLFQPKVPMPFRLPLRLAPG